MSAVLDQLRERIRSLTQLQAAGIDPYPYVSFEPVPASRIHQAFDEWQGKIAVVAGRLVARRIMGAVTFLDIEDESGRIQLYVHRDHICPGEEKTFYRDVVRKWLDLGDILQAEGTVFRTKTGEVSIDVRSLTLLAKALRPPPIAKRKGEKAFSELKDPETRHRQRYLDLMVHPRVREVFRRRTQLIDAIRNFLNRHNCLEVETPVLHPVYGGAHARPFQTTVYALGNMPVYLRIANELYLKRLVIGGFERVYEFSRDFRNEGIDRTHHPEFTMLEVYIAYRDYQWMAQFTEQMLTEAIQHVAGTLRLPYSGKTIDWTPPWQRITYLDGLRQATGQDIQALSDTALRDLAIRAGIDVEGLKLTTRAQIIDKLFGTLVEPHLWNPTLVFDFPRELSPLAKRHRQNPTLAERFELICGGMEIANAYTEQNIPWEQRARFLEQQRERERGDEEAMPFDEDFLLAMEYGMPPMAGLGVGIDRLTMLVTDQPAIQEVILFPLMRVRPVHEYAVSFPYEELPSDQASMSVTSVQHRASSSSAEAQALREQQDLPADQSGSEE